MSNKGYRKAAAGALDDVSLNLVDSFDMAESFMSWLGERRQVLACDTETGGLDWWREPLRLVQFGDLGAGWVIPWGQGGWGGLARDALRRYTGPLAFHNLKFDTHFLESNGCEVKRSRLHDTFTMAHLLNPSRSLKLKDLGVSMVDRRAANGQSALARAKAINKWTWRTIPVEVEAYWMYSALDPVLTAHLYNQMRPQISAGLNEVYELEVACLLLLKDMEVRGVRVDLEYCEEKRGLSLEHAEGLGVWIKDHWGMGPGQHKLVSSRLMGDGVKLTKRTESGGFSVDEEVLAAVDHPLAEAVLEHRKWIRIANTYFGNFIGFADGDILHPDVRGIGAVHGRMSVSRPALQQVPRKKLLRDPFVPRDGNRLVSVDWDQLEARLMGHFSGDKALIAAFGEGDFFANLAQQIYADKTIVKGDPRRQRMKSTVYSKMYGAGAETFAHTAKIKVAEAQRILAAFDRLYPGVRRYQREIEREALSHIEDEGVAYVTTPLGRREPCDPDETYVLTNYMISGTAADMFKKCLVDLDRAGLGDAIVLPVHDEVLFDVPEDDADELAATAVAVFEAQGEGLRAPITAGAEMLTRWGDKYL